MAAHPSTCNSTGSINPSNRSEYQLYHVLERANLLGYFNNFIQQGGDDLTQLCEASDEEFMEILALVGMSSKPLHIRRLQKSLQEWAKENSVPFMQTQSASQPLLNSMPYASTLVGLQPQSQPQMGVGSQWGQGHQSMSNQWPAGQSLTSEHSSPSDSPQQNSSYTQQGMPQQTDQASSQRGGTNGKTAGASGADPEECTDPRTLRQVAQRIMAAHTPSPISQTSQNKKLLSSVQHVIEMSSDHPQRLEEIQKWAPIYGRFDSKRKDDKPLTAHEISVNEAAIQLCCMDPYLLVQRDKLFPLARQVVRESGYHFKHGHSRSLKVNHNKAEDRGGSRPKRIKLDSNSGPASYRDLETTAPNPRTVQAEILKLRREERMNEILMDLNSIVQKQSDIKASIAAARSEDNIQQVYDLKVQLEKLTTQQLLLMTEQTDLIKRQRRSDRYYVAKARAEEENGSLANRLDPRETTDDSEQSDPDQGSDCLTLANSLRATSSPRSSAPPATESARTPNGNQLLESSGNSDLAQSLLMQHTLMNEGLRVAQNYALDGRGSSGGTPPGENGQQQLGETASPKSDTCSREDAASRAAESTITALLSLSSNKNHRHDTGNCEVNM